MKTTIISSTSAFIALLFFSSCSLFDRDIRINNRLEGTWEVYYLSNDEANEALIPNNNGFKVEFEFIETGDQSGLFFYHEIIDNDRDTDTGNYSISGKGDHLTISWSSGDIVVLNLEVKKDDLKISNSNGIARAKRI